MADTALISTQNSQKFAFYVPFLDRFSGFWHPIEALQHFFSSLLKLLGQRLSARDFERQVAEFQVRVAVMNGLTALGIPVTETVG